MSDIIIYKRIDRWTTRPGVVAIATILQRTEPQGPKEVDVRTNEEAIFIANKILKSLTIWEHFYNKIVVEAPSEIRDFLWNTDSIDFKPIVKADTWRKDVMSFAQSYENMLLCDQPGRNAILTLGIIRSEILHHERFINMMKNPDYYPTIP